MAPARSACFQGKLIDKFIAIYGRNLLADRWRPDNAIDGRYIWLPVLFRDDTPFLEWRDRWSLDTFPR